MGYEAQAIKMARVTLAVALLALLCVSSSFAAPLNEENDSVRAALGCQTALADVQKQLTSLATQDVTLALLVPDIQGILLKCAANPTAAVSCITSGLQGDQSKAQSAIKEITNDIQNVLKDVQSLPSKCLGGIGGTPGTG